MILNIPYEIYNTLDDKKFFKMLMNYQGEACSIKSDCKTSWIAIAGDEYYIRQHSGVGYWPMLKNLFKLRLPIMSTKNEWLALEKCQQLGIATVPLVGYGASGLNPLKRQSFVITRALKDKPKLQTLVENQWRECPPTLAYKRKIIKQLAQMVSALHHAGMYHQQLYLEHFLLDERAPDPQVFFMDLSRVVMKDQLTFQNRIQDLSALLYSSFNGLFSVKDYFYFLKNYTRKSLKCSVPSDFVAQVVHQAKNLYRKNYGCLPQLPAALMQDMKARDRMNQKIPTSTAPYVLCLEDGSNLKVQTMLRFVPNKRWIVKATWQNKPVVAKIFAHEKRFYRELRGIEKCQAANILTPKLLHQGKIPAQNAFVLIFDFIPSDENIDKNAIENLIRTIATHHDNGIMQTDMHIGNFIQNDQQIVTLDTTDIVTVKEPLANLALLLAQFWDLTPDQLKIYFHYYCQLRNITAQPNDLSEFFNNVDRYKERRKQTLLKMVSQDSSTVTFWNRPRYKILMRNDAYSPQLSYFLHHIEQENAPLGYVVEQHATWNLLQPSPAVRRWRAMHLAEFTGQAEIIPIAVVEKTSWLRKTAYFVGRHPE